MELPYLDTLQTGGFNFDNYLRNEAMTKSGAEKLKLTSTGKPPSKNDSIFISYFV